MSIRPRVLHVCKVYLPEKGGVQVVVERLCKGLKNKFDFDILSAAKRRSKNDLGYARLITAKSLGNLFSLPIAPGIIIKLWREAPKHSLVAVHYPFPLADIAIALYPRALPNLIVYWHSEIVSQKVSSWLVKPFSKIMLRRARAIVCSSPNLIEHSKLLKPHHKKCEIVPFGVPNPSYGKTMQLKSPSESDYFITIARHVPYKGIGILIRAFAKSNTKFRLLIVGQGPLLNEHIKLTKQLNQASRIEFITDAGNAEVEKLLANSRALILPSIMRSEAFGLVQIEAMSLGRPVINTNLPSGVPWVARNAIEALTVRPDDVDELANAIQLFSKGHLVDEMGAAAQTRFDSLFGYADFLQHSEKLYAKIMALPQ